MVILSGLLSLGLMALTYCAYRRQGQPTLGTLCFAIGGVLAGFCLALPVLCLQAGLLVPALVVCCRWPWSVNTLLGYMALAGLASFGFVFYLAMEERAERQALREQYPFESLEARLPVPKVRAAVKPSKQSAAHWEKLEENVRSESNGLRALMLERLHQDSVRDFINSPGFGSGRRLRPTAGTLKINLDRDGTPVPQPGPAPSSPLAAGDLREAPDVPHDPLLRLHLGGILDFVNPRGFGLVVSRRKVAGFQAHQFAAVPEAKEWKVRTLELVGLLMHDEPVVYVSDELPRMDGLRQAPTRPLNAFEAAGLKRLQAGEDLFVRRTHEGVRMLGAVRSLGQCLKCHGGRRGDLLGAFAYTLQPVP